MVIYTHIMDVSETENIIHKIKIIVQKRVLICSFL